MRGGACGDRFRRIRKRYKLVMRPIAFAAPTGEEGMARRSAKRILPAISLLPPLLLLGTLGISGGILPAAAQAPATLSEAQDVNGHPGVMAEIGRATCRESV